MHVCGMQKIMRQLCERAGGNVSKNVTCHTMRHTCATVMTANNANIVSVQKILGHSSLNTTIQYIHAKIVVLRIKIVM